ncbi:glycosyl hydrolase family 95 catalytic domain-containing protein [Robinsoniella peoriensis]|uniref:glycoside hydrolase family 95 protein n=1 Tax=Robinsoniella peoriensis TaxID=180332 RepID=UPI00085C027D|nr:glycoside hydrolase N-terminal domain-containing protein [Robinsoniella peoriensis]
MREKDILWYKNPAKVWIEALPLGNGRIGAMDYGGSIRERIQIDESSFWSGERSEYNNKPESKDLIDQIRKELLKEDYEEADRLGHGLTGNKNNYGTNMPVADLIMELQNMDPGMVKHFRRSLDLSCGISETLFEYHDVLYKRTVLVSNPSQVVAIRFTSDRKKPFNMEISYNGIGNDTKICGMDGNLGLVEGHAFETLHSDGKTGVCLQGSICFLCDGEIQYKKDTVLLLNATELVVFMDIQTNMFEEDPQGKSFAHVKSAVKTGFLNVEAEHTRDVQSLFTRMDIKLGDTNKRNIPTDERIQMAADGNLDPDLYALLFQYGRYLLIASSRADSPLPTHMGGIWNDNIYNNIDCTQDMHIDMNLQMQYWLSAQCNLKESYIPLFNYIRNILVPSGEKTAAEVYRAKGWTAHVVSNPWGFTALGWSYNWGIWSLGGAWCTTLIWDYFTYTKDYQFLQREAYHIIKGAAEFILDYVFYDTYSGYYMTGPSYSPETMFRTKGKNYFLSISPTCDVLMVREILRIYLKMMEELRAIDGVMENDTAKINNIEIKAIEVLEKLPPYKIGARGQLQEWYYDFEEPIPNHRHTSHLLGLYPFRQIEPENMKDLADAARRSINIRYDNFEVTSWGMAMLTGHYARLNAGEEALHILKDTVNKLLKPNMASVMSDQNSMWMGTWELDGNTGITSVIGEMLLQSGNDFLHILPALPKEWTTGELKGICVRGGHVADISWEKGELKNLQITSYHNDIKKLSVGSICDKKDCGFGEIVLKKGKILNLIFHNNKILKMERKSLSKVEDEFSENIY